MRMKIWTVLALGMLAGVASAEPCVEIDDLDARLACFDRVAQCASISEDAQRLACYQDRPSTSARAPDVAPIVELISVPASVATPDVETSPEIIAAPETRQAKVESDDAAFPIRGRPSQTKGPQVNAVITRVRRNPQGIVYLDLDNGQVWKETTRTKFRYRSGLAVTISEGTVGSTNLHAEGMKKYAKVVRVN